MIGEILHTADCGIRFNDCCGFGCHGTDQANLLRLIRKHADKLRELISVWLDSPAAFIRHRAVKHAIKRRRAGFMIVDVDNFNRDYQTEYFVEGDFATESEARARSKVLTLERRLDEHSDRYLTVRQGSSKLYVFDGY